MSEYFSDNMNQFLARFNTVIETELVALEKLSSEARARVNANKCRMIKANIAFSTDPRTPFNTMTPEEQKYRNSAIEQAHASGRVIKFRNAIDNYMNYIKSPENDNIRHFIDADLPGLDSVEKFIELVNLAHLDYLFDNYNFPCPCGAKSDTFESILYANFSPGSHGIVACKGKCSLGTKMVMDDASALLKTFDFIDYGSEFSITFSKTS
jgi:hypothetical protein